MKARIVPPAPARALAWGIGAQSAQYAPLAAACEQAGLGLRLVAGADLQKTVAALCGLPGAKEAPQAPPKAGAAAWPPALVLYGLQGEALERFLDRLRAAGVQIPLKAVVTPTNQAWRFAALLDELLREHSALDKK